MTSGIPVIPAGLYPERMSGNMKAMIRQTLPVKTMTAAGIAEAQRLAGEWRPGAAH
jgi:hypothetical protein